MDNEGWIITPREATVLADGVYSFRRRGSRR